MQGDRWFQSFVAVISMDESVHWYWYWFFQSTDHFWYWCTGTGTGTGPVFKYWLCTGTDHASTESISTSTKTKEKAKNQAKKLAATEFSQTRHIFLFKLKFQTQKVQNCSIKFEFPALKLIIPQKIEISRRFCSIICLTCLLIRVLKACCHLLHFTCDNCLLRFCYAFLVGPA